MTTPAPSASLADLVGAPVDLPVGKIKIKVQPLGWYDSVGAVDILAPAILTMPTPPAKGEEVSLEPWLLWLQANRDTVNVFLAFTTNQPADSVKRIGPTHLIELFFGVLEINADFFVESLPGAVKGLVERGQALFERVKAAVAEAGIPPSSSAPSSTSSSTATATPT